MMNITYLQMDFVMCTITIQREFELQRVWYSLLQFFAEKEREFDVFSLIKSQDICSCRPLSVYRHGQLSAIIGLQTHSVVGLFTVFIRKK